MLPVLGYTQTKSLFFLRSNSRIDKLVLLPPVSQIFIISKGSKLHLDSGLSETTYRNTSAQLLKSFPDSLSITFFSADSVARSKLSNFVITLNKKSLKEHQVKKYHLPDSIIKLFDTSKINYVFCTFNSGFSRTRSNLINTYQALQIVDVMTGTGLRPLESNALMCCFILDLKKKNILYFERDLWQEKDPTDISVIKLQLIGIITHYFF